MCFKIDRKFCLIPSLRSCIYFQEQSSSQTVIKILWFPCKITNNEPIDLRFKKSEEPLPQEKQNMNLVIIPMIWNWILQYAQAEHKACVVRSVKGKFTFSSKCFFSEVEQNCVYNYCSSSSWQQCELFSSYLLEMHYKK